MFDLLDFRLDAGLAMGLQAISSGTGAVTDLDDPLWQV